MASSERHRPRKYLVNARWSLGSVSNKLFFVFLVGRDRRLENIPQISDQRTNSSLAKAIVYTGIFTWFLAGFLILTFVVLYLAKSYAGFDLVPNGHPFPEFLKRIGICH
jgi:hypothetical protein